MKTTYVIHEDDCDAHISGEGRRFESFLRINHPEIEIIYCERTSGVGGTLFDENWLPIQDDLWDEYCNA